MKIINMIKAKLNRKDNAGVAHKEPVICHKIIGKKVEDARIMAERARWQFRIAREDGKDNVLSQEVRADRINVVVEKGKVTKAWVR